MQLFQTFITTISIALAIVGVILSFIGCKQSKRKLSFGLIMLYFIISLCSLTIARPIKKWLVLKHFDRITQDEMDQYAELNKEIEVLYSKYPRVNPYTTLTVEYIGLPFGQILLIAGLWFLVRKQKES
jgi:hypothetical protein